MVYSQKFVMCVLVNGVPQKELANGEVHIPFGSEYEIRFRNKNDRRAKVQFELDGENVSDGGYIIEPNSHIDIKRHASHDARFKFVDLDSGEAVDAGKNGPNPDKVKGTIVANFWLEKERPKEVHHHHHHDHYIPTPVPVKPYYPSWPSPIWGDGWDSHRVTCDTNPQVGSNGGSGGGGTYSSLNASIQGQPTMSYNASQTKGISGQHANRGPLRSLLRTKTSDTVSISGLTLSDCEVKDGCTVEGSVSGQTFRTVSGIVWEATCTTLRCYLRGTESVQVTKVNTNKDRRLSDVEAENEALRQRLAELENEQLKAKLETQKPKIRKQPVRKKNPKK